MPGYSNVPWVCSTGLAQLAKVWFALGDGDRADKALAFLAQLQNPSGGFFGSYGVGADYFPSEEISWAVKYAVEATQCRITDHFDKTVSAYQSDIREDDGRVQAVLHHLGDLHGKTVLDAGCGKGRYTKILKRRFPSARLTALDISSEMLDAIPSDVEKVQSGMLSMPLADGHFDAVLCVEALEHAVNIPQAVAEMTRVLRPGGTVVIIDKNVEKVGLLERPDWEKWFSRDGLRGDMERAGLEVVVADISYEDHREPDGLFVCWTGTKPSRPAGVHVRYASVPDVLAVAARQPATNGHVTAKAPVLTVEKTPARPRTTAVRVPDYRPSQVDSVRTFNPRLLLGDRLGVTLYCLVVEEHLRGGGSRAHGLYERFIHSFNEQDHHSIRAFGELIDAMTRTGYDYLAPVYGNPKEFALVNGAHRCAAAIVLGVREIPYCLRFADERTPDEAFARIFSRDELELLRSEQDRLIGESDSQTALICKIRKIIREHPKSFSAPFSSKNAMQAIRPYQGLATLGIRGKRPVEERLRIYGIPDFIHPHMHVLEMGCNSGFLALQTASFAKTVTAFDADPVYIRVGNLVKDHLGVRNCTLFASPVEQFQSTDTFDAIISCAVHGWISLSFEQYIQKILGLMKPNGILVFESHELDCHPEAGAQREHLMRFFHLLRRGYIDDVDESLYQSELREYLILQRK